MQSSAPPSLAPQVHLHELALLVHGFLRRYSATFPKAFAAFREESAPFRSGVSAGGKVKTLESIMNEFLELKHSRVRQSFVSAHASAILEPRLHATLAGIADLVDDYRLLRESPRAPIDQDLFENEHPGMPDSPHNDNLAPNMLLPGRSRTPSSPRPFSSNASLPSSSLSAAAVADPANVSPSNESSHSAVSPAGGGRRKKKLPRRRKQTGTSVVLGKRNLDEIGLDSRSRSSGEGAASVRQGNSYSNSVGGSTSGDKGRSGSKGDVMDMSLNSLGVRSLWKIQIYPICWPHRLIEWHSPRRFHPGQ